MCLSRGARPGSLTAGNSTKNHDLTTIAMCQQLHCGSHQTTQKMKGTQVTQPRKANFQHFYLKLPCWVSYFYP